MNRLIANLPLFTAMLGLCAGDLEFLLLLFLDGLLSSQIDPIPLRCVGLGTASVSVRGGQKYLGSGTK